MAQNLDAWGVYQEVYKIVSPILGLVVLLVVYIWNNKIKRDEKAEEKYIKMCGEREMALKKWVSEREEYLGERIIELKDLIEKSLDKLFDKANQNGLNIAKLDEKIASIKEKCDDRHHGKI